MKRIVKNNKFGWFQLNTRQKMFALDAAQQQQNHHVQVEQQRQIRVDQQAQTTKQDDVAPDQDEDDVGNNSIVEGVTSPPPSVAHIDTQEVSSGGPQGPNTSIQVSSVDNVTVTTEHDGASRRNNQPLFVHANSQNHQMPSMLLNVNPNPHHHHFHHNGSSASSTPVVSPLASPIASPQPSYQASLPAAPSTTSSSTSTNCFSRASHNQLSWPIRSIALPSIPSSNQQETVSATNIVQGQQTQTFLQAQQSHNPFPLLLHHSAQHLQQNHHPLPHVLPQHPLQPSFNNPRTDPTVPPGCREHGFNLIGQKYLLHDQIEGSHLQRCIEVETQNEYVCKVSSIAISRNYY